MRHSVEFETYGPHCAKNFSTGEYCQFVRFYRFATVPICALFEEEILEDVEHLLLRCESCQKQFKDI